MSNDAKVIQELRKLTEAPILDCKKVLLECNGDMKKAKEILLERGFKLAQKRGDRVTAQGLVVSYIHHNGSIGVLAEINCETDFVAKNSVFKELADEITMQIAGCAPLYVCREDIPADILDEMPEKEKESYCKTHCLLEQAYVRDSSLTINDLIVKTIGRLGENVRVRRFARYKIGEYGDK